ncbi:TRAP-type C4-dicarboxylate transport system permease small subunit [Azospirillum agricola]|uniref:DUF3325 family protein n=1 Tax=Azospirillum agricola TaxID=1720247 RepID=UPI001AE4D6C6|nr:DUF3325 family protein [Azospirillum agricola]MBP2228660.1 TRAP-type C4-dicarboxylate transport system permease small subunit [Azospirillum agricola]
MSHLPPLLLALAGFTALAFATDRQQHDLLGRPLPPSATRALRIAGAAALLLALGALVAWKGWGLGLVMFSGHASLAAGVVLGALILRARAAARAPKR